MSNPSTFWNISEELLLRTRLALENGLENTREALATHDSNLGRTTYKNKWWAEELERQKEQMEAVLKDLPSPLSIP